MLLRIYMLLGKYKSEEPLIYTLKNLDDIL